MADLIPITFGSAETEKPVINFDHGKLVDLTASAVNHVKNFLKNTPEAQNKKFRIYVEGGGCSGFQYGFTFDEQRDDDNVIKCEDVEVLVDQNTVTYVNGAVVDYFSDFRGSGFTVHNPQAKASCGCGVSFSV